MSSRSVVRRARAQVCAAILAAAAAGLSACVLSVDTSQINDLATAAAQFRATASGGGPAAAAREDADKARFLQFIVRGQLPPISGCAPLLDEEKAFDVSVVQTNDQISPTWKTLLNTAPCAWGSALVPDAPNAPPEQPIITALQNYYAGVAAIASASSIQQVIDATNKTTAAVKTIASLAPGVGAPATAAATIVGKLVQYSLQTAQYQALEAVLGDVDPILDQASQPVIGALRVQQGYWISQTSFFSSEGVEDIHLAVSAAGSPGERLAVLQVAQPILADLSSQQQSVRVDPSVAYLSLIAAHHKLYAVLKSGKGQLAGALAAAEDIAGAAKSMASATSSASPTTVAAKTGAPRSTKN